MSYQSIGYVERSDSEVLPPQAVTLFSTLGAGFASDMTEFVNELGQGSRFVSSISLADVAAIQTKTLPIGGDLNRAATNLLIYLLYRTGFLDARIPYWTYRKDPIVEWEKLPDFMFGSFIEACVPSRDALGGDNARLSSLPSWFYTFVQNLAYISRYRKLILARLRLKLLDIAFRIYYKQPITNREKTFYLLYSDKVEKKESVENSDPLVDKAYVEMEGSTESGPYLDFVYLVSNMSFENNMMWKGPITGNLPMSMGFRRKMGDWYTYEFTRVYDTEWTPETQLTGMSEELGSIIVAPPGSANGATVRIAPPAIIERPSSLSADFLNDRRFVPDMEGVDIHMDSPANSADYKLEWMGPFTKRIMRSDSPEGLQSMFTDLALTKSVMGNTRVEHVTIDDIGTAHIDSKIESRRIDTRDPNDPTRPMVSEEVHYVKGGTLVTKTLDVTSLYSHGGTMMYRPAFAEFMFVPSTRLWQEDEAFLSFAASELNLTRFERNQNEKILALSHNCARL